jgi:hypothetical protein
MVTQHPPPPPARPLHDVAGGTAPTLAPPCPLLGSACGVPPISSAARPVRPRPGRWRSRRWRSGLGVRSVRSGAVGGLGRLGSASHASAALFWSSACTMAAVVRGGSP